MNAAAVLNLVIYLPLIGAMVLAFMPRGQVTWIKNGALGVSVLTLLLSLALIPEFQVLDNGSFQFVTAAPWVPALGIQYKLGVDGIGLVLIVLTTLLSAISILSSFDAIKERVREYYIFLLLLETGMLGVFAALDLVLFYVFWEAMLIPMYFLIGMWGGPRKLYATIKFVLYTLVGSLLMLVAIVWLYVATSQGGGSGTFDLQQLIDPNGPLASAGQLGPEVRLWLFLAFAAAFAIKVPIFPLHTWLPDAHVEAPTAGSVILAGVLLKMGTYGFVRFCIPLFPEQAIQTAPFFIALGLIGIVYGAMMAYVQTDVKRLVAYSSVSHLGFCVLGLFVFTAEGVAGSVLQMLNHGISTGALFLLVGMIYERRHTREIAHFGGLWKVIPVFTLCLLITTLSSIGLPFLNGFVGEFMILAGTWGTSADGGHQGAAVIASTGVILGAVYMLWMLQRVTQGPLTNQENRRLRDLSPRELCTILPLVALMFWIGLAPNWTLSYFDKAVMRTVVEPIGMARSRLEPSGAPALPGLGLPGPGRPGRVPGGMPAVPRPAPVMPPGAAPGATPSGGLESPPEPPPPPAGASTAPGGAR